MIPTLRSVDHVAFTVPDLDAAVTFLVDHLGGELVFTDGPFADPDGSSIARRLDVDAKASCMLAMVRVGRINVELFAYDAPGQSVTQLGHEVDETSDIFVLDADLTGYDLIVLGWNNALTTEDLTDAQEFRAARRGGGGHGVAAWHGAAAAFRSSPPYHFLLGGDFVEHPGGEG